MEKHITLVGILNIVYRSWTAFGGLVLLVIGVGFEDLFRLLDQEFHVPLDEIPQIVFVIVPIVLVCLGGLVLLVSAAGIIGATGVLKRKEWGRILLLVVSFFTLLRVPLGTLLGGYSIWVLLKDETVRHFNEGR